MRHVPDRPLRPTTPMRGMADNTQNRLSWGLMGNDTIGDCVVACEESHRRGGQGRHADARPPPVGKVDFQQVQVGFLHLLRAPGSVLLRLARAIAHSV